ncbi:MAG: hypothetical protein U0264_01570 [Candidatus Kapaibacterium sp.]
MASLLGQFYTRIKGSQEDIASEGLSYILQRSNSARQALNKIIKLETGLHFENISYSTQNVGEKLERPDISGFSSYGKEVVIVEAKFWASLTDNQPIEYLNRLSDHSILIFICPTLRIRSIFDEIVMRVKKTELNNSINYQNHSISFENDKNLIVKTWNEVLGIIRLHLTQDNEHALLSDLDQIIGLCETIDNNSFQPYQNEDFAPSIARKINSYYNIADKVIDELKKRGIADTTNLKVTPQKYGYSRYFKFGTLGVSLNVNFDYWERYADTPLWLCLKEATDKNWVQSIQFKSKTKIIANKLSIQSYENNKRELYIPIFPLIDKTEEIVIKDISDQIIAIVNGLAESTVNL